MLLHFTLDSKDTATITISDTQDFDALCGDRQLDVVQEFQRLLLQLERGAKDKIDTEFRTETKDMSPEQIPDLYKPTSKLKFK